MSCRIEGAGDLSGVCLMSRWVTWLAVVFVACTALDAAASEPKRMLLLQSFGREFAPFNEFSVRFREELVRRWPQPLDIYEASLDTARLGDARGEGQFADYLRALFGGRRLDLIVSVGGPAASFVQRHRGELFPATPMLITALEERNIDASAMTANDTVVAIRLDFGVMIDNILRLLPETANVAIALGASPLERYWRGEMPRDLQRFAGRPNFIWLDELSFEEMRKRAATLPPRSAVLYWLLFVDAHGVPHEQDRALGALHAQASAPIFSFLDRYVGRGIVGGPVLWRDEISDRAAAVAIRLLAGEAAGDIKTPPLGLGTPVYDWRELRRWKISEARLPPCSIVQFREPTVWEQHRWPLTAIAAVMLIQAMMIAWLLVERRRRHAAELESRRRMIEVVHLNQTAAAGALSASIAHELNQPLGTIMSNAEAAEMLLGRDAPDLDQIKEILADIRKADAHAAGIIDDVRRLLKRRSEIELESFDLNEAVRGALDLLDPQAMKRGIALSANGIDRPLPVRADQIHLQQVVLNLAMNGVDAAADSASGDRKVMVQTTLLGDDEVEVSVADSGAGIPVDKLEHVFDGFYTTKRNGTGLGLSISRTIVESYGGRIWAENRAGGGAVLRFTLPLAEPQPT
jgi:signal transduction histidine kinase